MALSGEEIRARLSAFAARWSVYEGSERGEAQTFLNELFECYGTRRSDVATFEQPQAGRFLDLIWPRVCLIEMKAPSEAKKLAKHRPQAFDYWRDAADPEKGVPSPEYVVICAFRRLEIWEPGKFPNKPRVELDLIDLPDQYDALLFLAGREPVFAGGQAALTREAVVHITDLYDRLRERRAAELDVLRDFVLQSVWCLFAEDLGQIPEHRFTRVVDQLLGSTHRSSADDLHGLFEWLNDPSSERPGHGQYAGTPYANGGLFESPARVHLEPNELEHLRAAAEFNWPGRAVHLRVAPRRRPRPRQAVGARRSLHARGRHPQGRPADDRGALARAHREHHDPRAGGRRAERPPEGGTAKPASTTSLRIADFSRHLYTRRSEVCIERNIGLTKLYNQMDDGAWADLRELHKELDEAVALAYGWPASVAHDPDESNRRLLELNRAIVAGEVDYKPFS